MDRFIKGICHFGFSVADLDESIAFYTGVLGLEKSERREMDALSPIGTDDVMANIPAVRNGLMPKYARRTGARPLRTSVWCRVLRRRYSNFRSI